MKKLLFGALGLMMVSATFAQDKYQVKIDLTAAANDQVPVEVIIPQSDDELVEYHMAKVVPGTYSISDFGRFVSDFKNSLRTTKLCGKAKMLVVIQELIC